VLKILIRVIRKNKNQIGKAKNKLKSIPKAVKNKKVSDDDSDDSKKDNDNNPEN
jgi:hypothetical protein